MKGIDLFAGAGGMSIGAEWAGVDVCLAIENEVNAAATYSKNNMNCDVICDDISQIENLQTLRPKGEVVLFGGPPCQGFSTSNQKTRNSSNKNNWLFKEFLRAVSQMSPEWVVFENVKGITETENAKFLTFVLSGLEALGYQTTFSVLNAKDFGVPQERSRLFIIATNTKSNLSLPVVPEVKIVTVGEAISDLPILENGANEPSLPYRRTKVSEYAKFLRGDSKRSMNNHITRNASHILERYKYVPQGGNWENIPDHLMGTYADRNRCHTGIYRRLKLDQVSSVIGNYRKNMLIHPKQDRGLSVREAARIQSFPDNYVFEGTIGFQQQQVGNAVPPLLSKYVFERLFQ